MYTLMDGAEQNTNHPETFQIPTEAEKRNVKVRQHVKLCFEEEDEKSERMWVLVAAISGGNFEGTLDNDPFGLTTIKHGDTVKFNSKHIINID